MTALPFVALLLAGKYTVHMASTDVPLGAPGTAELRVSPPGTTPGLGHPGLVIELRTVDSREEPAQAFPNQRTVASAGRTIRMQTDTSAPGPPVLVVNLLDLFPEKLMRAGRYALSFRIEGANLTINSPSVRFAVTARRESVLLLFALLRSSRPPLRMVAAANLQRLTGQGFDWDPARPETVDSWTRWWERDGRRMPWKDGVVYQLQPAPADVKRAILAGSAPAPPNARYLPDAAVTAALIRRLEREGPSASLFEAMAAMPDPAMAYALRKFPGIMAARGLLQIVTR